MIKKDIKISTEAVVESKGIDMGYRKGYAAAARCPVIPLILLTIATGAIASKWTIWTIILGQRYGLASLRLVNTCAAGMKTGW